MGKRIGKGWEEKEKEKREGERDDNMFTTNTQGGQTDLQT